MGSVLAVASECSPLVKTGGLADVIGALPGALEPLGWRLRVLLPGYRQVMAAIHGAREVLAEPELFGGPARVLAAEVAGLDLLIVDAPHLFDRAGSPYLDPAGADWTDNDLRFAALSWIAARVGAAGLEGWRPDILHLHDWQAGFAAVYSGLMNAPARRLMTIHNMAFHGLTDALRLNRLRLPVAGFTAEGFEYYGRISALKAGLVWADSISTVSPRYAQELTTPEFGMGLEGVIRRRKGDLAGILNGIDTTLWNPATDPHIRPFGTPRGKAANRRALLDAFGLTGGEGPLCAVVSRLSHQKGLDLLLEALPTLEACDGRLALLGSGDHRLEADWRAAALSSPAVGVRIGYDDALARLMFAGADAVIVPSRFEPCGLTQLYALRYGAVPVVSLTGGLADTVINANEAARRAGVATGLHVNPIDTPSLACALVRLCDLYRDGPAWARMRRNAMSAAVGWEASAPQYAAIYDNLVQRE